MQEFDAKYFHLIAGAGNHADGRDDRARLKNMRQNNGRSPGKGGFYGKHTSPNCVNGIIAGSLGGLGGLALGALNGGCFTEGGGGNLGMGKGGSKDDCHSGKGGNSCSR